MSADDMAQERTIRVFADADALASAAAELFARQAEATVAARGRLTVALAGGTTPNALYDRLATDYRDAAPWHAIHFFWGDERHVPPAGPVRVTKMRAGKTVKRGKKENLTQKLESDELVHTWGFRVPNAPSRSRPRAELMAIHRGKGAGQFQKQIRSRREDELTQVTCALLLARGCGDVRVEEVAAECGVAKGTCYQHFETRGALLTAAVRYL